MSKLRYLQAASAPGHVVAQRVVREWGGGVATAMFRPKNHCPLRLKIPSSVQRVCSLFFHWYFQNFKIKPGPRYEPHTGLLCIKLC